jgi:hypothetical protein
VSASVATSRFRRIGLGLAALGALLALAGLAWPNFIVTIPEDKAQAEVRARLPKEISRLNVKVTITDIALDFRDDNKVGVIASASATGFGLAGTAEVETASGIRYESGKFYLSDLSLDDIKLKPDDASAPVLADRIAIVQGALAAARARVSDTTRDGGGASDRERARLVERLLPLVKGLLEDSLRSIPIYDLAGKDLKRDLAAMALTDVRFTADAVQAELSPNTFVSTVLLYALACGLGLLSLLSLVLGHRMNRGKAVGAA